MAEIEINVASLAKRKILKILNSHGYKNEAGYSVMHRDGLTLGFRLHFLNKGKSEISQLSIEIFAWSERVAEIMDFSTKLRWREPLISVLLRRLITGRTDQVWVLRKDHAEDVDLVVADVQNALEAYAFPFLDAIKCDHDVVRIMRDTVFTEFGADMRKRILASYLNLYPEL